MVSNAGRKGVSRRVLLAGALAGCAAERVPMGPAVRQPAMTATSRAGGHFVMADGAALPYRVWMPARPTTVLLALHGYNDSRDAWEIPAPAFVKAGIGIVAPDQRGFGHAPDRGLWPGTDTLVSDAAAMARLVAAHYKSARFAVMGESMGGAVAMIAAARGLLAPGTPVVLSAPAVWGAQKMNVFMRAGLWVMRNILPWASASQPPVPIRASDNRAALEALYKDPLTIRTARYGTLVGLVHLMTAALRAAPFLPGPALFLYGAHDELVPKRAMLAAWRAVRPGVATFCYFRHGWHLLLRDHDRALVIGDIVAWLHGQRAKLVGEQAAQGLLTARYPALE